MSDVCELSVGNNTRRPNRRNSGERRRRDNDDDNTVLDNQDRSSVTSQDPGMVNCDLNVLVACCMWLLRGMCMIDVCSCRWRHRSGSAAD